jgi:biopolymer transport protein TolR
VSVNLPHAEAAPLTGEEDQLVVAIDRQSKTYLNDSQITLAELDTKLRAILRERPDRQVYLRADRDVRYGDVMEVIAAVKGAGVQRLGMVTEPETQG